MVPAPKEDADADPREALDSSCERLCRILLKQGNLNSLDLTDYTLSWSSCSSIDMGHGCPKHGDGTSQISAAEFLRTRANSGAVRCIFCSRDGWEASRPIGHEATNSKLQGETAWSPGGKDGKAPGGSF